MRQLEGTTPPKQKNITLALTGVALTRFFALSLRSIYAWEQLWGQLHNNFQGNYTEPKDERHMFTMRQGLNESLQSFFKRFAEVKCQLKGVTDNTIINAARCGSEWAPWQRGWPKSPSTRWRNCLTKWSMRVRRKIACIEQTRRQLPRWARPASRQRRTDNRQVKQRVLRRPMPAMITRTARGGGDDSSFTSKGATPPPKEDDEARWCELHGEGTHPTKECRTIAAMRDYMNKGPVRDPGEDQGHDNPRLPAQQQLCIEAPEGSSTP